MPPSAPNSLGEIRLERLRRLAELKARKAAKDAQTVQNVAARFPLPGDLAKLIDPTTVVTPALQMLDANLLEIAEGQCERLIFSLPPQEGKARGSRATSHCGCCCGTLRYESLSLHTNLALRAGGLGLLEMISQTTLN